MLKFDAAGGSVTWQKTYGGSGSDQANSIKQTSDGGYVVAGYTDSSGEGDDDIWILKLTSNGTVDWHRNYGGIDLIRPMPSSKLLMGDIFVVGDTLSFGIGGRDVLRFKN